MEKIPTIDQETLYKDVAELRPAPKIFKETCELHYDQTVRKLHNLVRGLSPYPAAWTELTLSGGEKVGPVKVYRTRVVSENQPQPAEKIGTVETDQKSYIHVVCADGVLALEELQLPGKKRMEVKALLNGVKLKG